MLRQKQEIMDLRVSGGPCEGAIPGRSARSRWAAIQSSVLYAMLLLDSPINELERPKGEEQMVRPQSSSTLSYLLIMMLTSACGVAPSGTAATQVPTAQSQPSEAPILDVTPTVLPASTELPVSEEIFDGRISILMVSVETTIEPIADYELPAAGGGNKYIVFRLTVPRIVDTHLVDIMGFDEEQPTLQLADDQIYDVIFGQFTGVQFTDPTDIRSPYEFVEGTEGVLIFEIPENGTPVALRLPYSY